MSRNRIIAAIGILAVSSVALASGAGWYQSHPGAVPMTSRMDWSAAPTRSPPLDAPIFQRRGLTEAEATQCPGCTHSLVGLMMESRSTSSAGYPWLQYSELDTRHSAGADGVVQRRFHGRLHALRFSHFDETVIDRRD